jgi:N-dimethylarginine dimethylaminohydrolase
MSDEIKIVVTQDRFEEIVSIEDSMYFLNITKKEAYDYMCNFVMNGENTYLSIEDAKKRFKKIPSKELNTYVSKFLKAVNDAFVNPTKGADSDEL